MMTYVWSESTRDIFGKFNPPIPTWNQEIYQETWKDPNKII